MLVIRDHDSEVQVLMARRKPDLRVFAGLWVFPGGSVDATDASLPTAAAREVLEETGLQILPNNSGADTDHIRAWARWITPAGAKRRFDTHFFLTPAPPGQEARCDDSEICEVQWVRPKDWAFGDLAEQFPIAPPTLFILRELAGHINTHSSVSKLMELARTLRIRPVLPKLHPSEPGTVIFPWDSEYEQLGGEGLPWDRESIAARADWPSRRRSTLQRG
jgi:8-oxo-dGTP pyrophosphatase MutT (NUDIX family)